MAWKKLGFTALNQRKYSSFQVDSKYICPLLCPNLKNEGSLWENEWKIVENTIFPFPTLFYLCVTASLLIFPGWDLVLSLSWQLSGICLYCFHSWQLGCFFFFPIESPPPPPTQFLSVKFVMYSIQCFKKAGGKKTHLSDSFWRKFFRTFFLQKRKMFATEDGDREKWGKSCSVMDATAQAITGNTPHSAC